MDERQISALAFVVATIRPAWEFTDIQQILRTSTKPFPDAADDAIDAARTVELKHPAVLRTHRRPDRQPVPPTPMSQWAKCERCHRDYLTATGCDCAQPRSHGCPDDLREQLRLKPRGATNGTD